MSPNPAGAGAGGGVDRVGWADQGGSARPDDPIATVGQRRDWL
jgi:hypothetical protein